MCDRTLTYTAYKTLAHTTFVYNTLTHTAYNTLAHKLMFGATTRTHHTHTHHTRIQHTRTQVDVWNYTQQLARTRFQVTLDRVTGNPAIGFIYHCCWPCVCDATDLIRVDSLTVPTKSGDVQMNFLVIGDP